MKKKRKYAKWTEISLIACIKTEDICIQIGKDVKTRFDTSNYKLNRTLSRGKNENIFGLMMDKLGRKIT